MRREVGEGGTGAARHIHTVHGPTEAYTTHANHRGPDLRGLKGLSIVLQNKRKDRGNGRKEEKRKKE